MTPVPDDEGDSEGLVASVEEDGQQLGDHGLAAAAPSDLITPQAREMLIRAAHGIPRLISPRMPWELVATLVSDFKPCDYGLGICGPSSDGGTADTCERFRAVR